jgi:hypothetical protein
MNKRMAEINFHTMKLNAGAFKIWRPGVSAGHGFGNIMFTSSLPVPEAAVSTWGFPQN